MFFNPAQSKNVWNYDNVYVFFNVRFCKKNINLYCGGFYENVNILVTDMFVHFSQAIIAFI